MANLHDWSFSIQGTRKKHTFHASTSEISINSNTNKSSMSISLTMDSTSWTWASYGSRIQYRLQVYDQYNEDIKYYDTGWINAPDHYPNADSNLVWVNNATFEIEHDSNGNRNIGVRFDIVDNANGKNSQGQYYTPGTFYGTEYYTLTTIPRYVSITAYNFNWYDETQANFSWTTDKACKEIAYQINNNGTWHTAETNINKTSGSFTVTGLSAGTYYSIQMAAKSYESNLWTYSGNHTFTTYNYPYITSISSNTLTIGGSQTVYFYNPLSRSCTLYMKQNNTSGTQLASQSFNGTSVTFTPTSSTLYNSIPNSKTGNAVYYCKYGNYTSSTKSGSYVCVDADCIPTLAATPITYQDINTATINITGDTSKIIQNKSKLSYTIAAASPKNGASIAQYVVQAGYLTPSRYDSIGAKTYGTVPFATNQNLTIYAVDSRGYSSATASVTISVIPWSKPVIFLDKLQRKNNYEAESYLQATIQSYSSLNGSNTVSLIYNYIGEDSSTGNGTLISITGAAAPIQSPLVTFASLDPAYKFTFTLTLADKLDTSTYTYILEAGVPLMQMRADFSGVGINKLPEGKGLYVNKIVTNNDEPTKIRGANGGGWVYDRNFAIVGNTKYGQPHGNSYNPVLSSKTSNGNWTIGNVSGEESLIFNYTTDTDYINGNNSSTQFRLKGDGGTIALLETLYPVGAIYITTHYASPEDLFGFGTWERIYGKFLWAANSNEGVRNTGGNSSVTLAETNLPAHTHSTPGWSGSTGGAGGHSHTSNGYWRTSGSGEKVMSFDATGSVNNSDNISTVNDHSHSVTIPAGTSGSTGSGTAFSIMPPWYSVYVWRRTA